MPRSANHRVLHVQCPECRANGEVEIWLDAEPTNVGEPDERIVPSEGFRKVAFGGDPTIYMYCLSCGIPALRVNPPSLS
jgi:hypothetical protein